MGKDITAIFKRSRGGVDDSLLKLVLVGQHLGHLGACIKHVVYKATTDHSLRESPAAAAPPEEEREPK